MKNTLPDGNQSSPATRFVRVAALLVFAGLCVFLTFNRHSKSGVNNYHSTIWADKAGYYIFLPATFIYRFDGNAMPDSIETKTGDGFRIEKDGTIASKYPVGTAMMQMPFFLAGHVLAAPLGYAPDGFSLIYHKMVDVAAVFWFLVGLWFLYSYLKRYLEPLFALIAALAMFLGTNLYYYAIDETGMSHVYSFALFSILLFLVSGYSRKSSVVVVILIGIAAGMIMAVRPVNLIFLILTALGSFLFFRNSCRPRAGHLIVMLSVAFVMMLPQMIYWKYMSGKFLYYSYQGEGFDHLLSPEIVSLWFAPHNGLFPYSPLLILSLAGAVVMWKKFRGESFLVLAAFVLISYLFASWWMWTYGCGFGCRPFVEYSPLFALSLGFLIQRVYNRGPAWSRIALLVLLLLFVSFNLKLTYTYDGCWYAADWDWSIYLKMISALPKG